MPNQISAADAPSLALDWNREWLIPANTNAWFPVKVFKDVALPGVYKVSVTGSTNIIVRYGGTCVRGGEPEEVAFPQGQSQETLEGADGSFRIRVYRLHLLAVAGRA